MLVSDFDYSLPEELIAQEPLADRAAARMLVLHRREQHWEDRHFRELPQFLGPGDCLVLNDSKVLPSRLFGRRVGVHAVPISPRNPAHHEFLTGQVQVFLVRPVSGDARTWEALVRPGRKMAVGERIRFADRAEAEILARGERGLRTLRFDYDGDLHALLDEIGHTPLPPYIRREDRPEDRNRYQTVYAQSPGSVAAPTAGLHFTPEMLDRCREAGAVIARVTLHVGLGTFQPLNSDVIEKARLHHESYEIREEEAVVLRASRRRIAVGTTSVRTLETAMRRGGLVPSAGETDLLIRPGFRFQATHAILTNFHLPQSSLLLLVSAFAGLDFTLAAYRHAVEQRYRFYSYGDCMLIL